MNRTFNNEKAKAAGYSDEEIKEFLEKNQKRDFNHEKAKKAGYSDEEINEFLSKSEKPKRSKLQKTGRIGAQAALGYASSAALPYELAVAPLANKDAQHVKLREKFFEEIEELGQRKRMFGLDEQDESKLQNLLNLVRNPEEAEKFVKTADISIKGLTEKAMGIDFTPEDSLERAANIFGGIKGLGGKAALKKPSSYLGAGAAAGTMAGLEESGATPLVALGGGILADILVRSGTGLLKKAATFAKEGFTKSAGKTTAELARIKPEQVKQGVIDAAQRLGVKELPLSAQVENPFIQGLEAKVRASSLAGEKLGKQLKRTGEELTEQYENIASQLSKRKEVLPGAISQEAIESLQRIEEFGKQDYRSLYSQASKALPEGAKISPKMGSAILNVINSTMKKLKSDLGTPAKDALYKRLERLKGNWKNPENIQVQSLLDAKRDLGDIIKYEAPGGADKLLNPLLGVTRNAIKQYGIESNPVFINRWREAEKSFGAHAQTFRKNPTLRSLIKGNAPEQIIGKMNSVKGIRELENVFGKTPEGVEAFDALKRYKLEEIIGTKLLNKKGEISWGNASGMFKKSKNRELVKELVGSKNFNTLKDIIKVSQGVEEGLKKFLNTSQTATAHLDVAMMVALPLKAIGYLFSGRPIKAAITAGGIFGPKVLANLMSNPEFIEAVKKTAQAGRGSNAERFIEEARRVASIVTAASLGIGDGMNEPSKIANKNGTGPASET